MQDEETTRDNKGGEPGEGIWPFVSVVIPTSRLDGAERTLQSLSRQSYVGKSEIILVGPPASELAQRWPIVAVNPGPIREPGRARNLGAARAKGTILLFLDDDMTVTDDWIAQNVRKLQEPSVGIVGARMPGRSRAFFARCVDFTNCGDYQHRCVMKLAVGAGSMGIHKTVFEQVGGFDTYLCSGEDIDLCYRVQKMGYWSVYQPEIVAIHDHQRETLRQLLQYNYRHGRIGGMTTKKRHQHNALRNRLVYSVRYPPLFLVLLPVMACLSMLRILGLNIRDEPRVILYTPFMLLGKIAYEWGIFRWLLQEQKSRKKVEWWKR